MNAIETLKQRFGQADVALLTAAFNSNMLGLALPIVIMQVYDRVIPNQSYATLHILIGGLVVVMLMDALVRAAQNSITSRSGLQSEFFQQMEAIDVILAAKSDEFNKTTIGSHLDQLKSIEQVQDFEAGHFQSGTVDVAFLLVNLLLIWNISGIMILVPLGIVGLFCLFSFFFANRIRKLVDQRSRLDSIRQDFLMEYMGAIHVVRSLAMEANPIRQYESLQASIAKNTLNNSQVIGLIQGMGILASQAIVVSFVSLGAVAVLNGSMGIGALAACTMLAGRILQPFLRGVALWAVFQKITRARESISELFSLEPEQRAKEEVQTINEARLEIKNLGYNYPGSDRAILKNININAPSGSMIGITGLNGSGKSTLLNLIAGNISPTVGEILIDGTPAELVDPGQISFLPQRGSLFRGSILDNIVMDRSGKQVAEAIRISGKLGLSETLLNMPLGLDTMVNTGDATSISNGVKQQILIVRNLCNNGPLILVDEANSQLDQSSDKKFVELLESLRGKHTIIINTHRPSLLKVCDRSYKITNTRLVPVDLSINDERQESLQDAS